MDIPKSFIPKDKNSCNTERFLKELDITNIIYYKREPIFLENLESFGKSWMKTSGITCGKLKDMIKSVEGYKSIEDHNDLEGVWFARLNFYVGEGNIEVCLPWISDIEIHLPWRSSDPIEVYATGKICRQRVEELIKKLDQIILTSDYLKKE